MINCCKYLLSSSNFHLTKLLKTFSETLKMASSKNKNKPNQQSSKWMKRKTKLSYYLGRKDRIIKMNENEFLNMFVDHVSSTVSFYSYNIAQNEFSGLVSLKKTITNDMCFNVSFDAITNKLYLHSAQKLSFYGEVDVVDLNALKWKHNIKNVPNGLYFMYIDDNIHVFNKPNDHFIASVRNGKLKTLSDTLKRAKEDIDILDPEIDSKHPSVLPWLNSIKNENYGRDTIEMFFKQQMRNENMLCVHEHLYGKEIYISSKRQILLIGGRHTRNREANMGQTMPKHPWIYSLESNEWTKVENVIFARMMFDAVLTSNQRYIVICGGSFSESIHVLDMKTENEWQLRKSTIVLPKKEHCKLLITGGFESKDEVLVIGYIRNCFQSKEFENIQLPPTYIMMMVAERYRAEMIHWIKDNEHHAIYLKDLLSSLS